MEKEINLYALFSKYKVHKMFGSKSGYHQENPDSVVLFNSYCLMKDSYGLLQKTYSPGDVDITKEETIEGLRNVGLELKESFYLYSESTVHNETFNGRIFPYSHWSLAVIYYRFCDEVKVIRKLDHSFKAKFNIDNLLVKLKEESPDTTDSEMEENKEYFKNLEMSIVGETNEEYCISIGDSFSFEYFNKNLIERIDE